MLRKGTREERTLQIRNLTLARIRTQALGLSTRQAEGRDSKDDIEKFLNNGNHTDPNMKAEVVE